MADNKNNNLFLESLPFKLGQTARVSELIGRSYYKKHLLNEKNILEVDEFVILSYLKQNPDASQAEISKFILKGKAHIGKILNNMEQKGYISRNVKIEKGIMIKHSSLTEQGETLYKSTDEKFCALARNALEHLTKEEAETFIKLLDKYKKILLENFEISF